MIVTPWWAGKGVRQKLPEYIGTGISQAEAARRIGCTRFAVCRALKRMGVTMDGSPRDTSGTTGPKACNGDQGMTRRARHD